MLGRVLSRVLMLVLVLVLVQVRATMRVMRMVCMMSQPKLPWHIKGIESNDTHVLRVFPLCALAPRVQRSSGAVATEQFVWRGHAKTPTTRAGPWPDWNNAGTSGEPKPAPCSV